MIFALTYLGLSSSTLCLRARQERCVWIFFLLEERQQNQQTSIADVLVFFSIDNIPKGKYSVLIDTVRM